MKLEKAIEMLGDYKMQSAFEATPAFVDALELGIEALKRIKYTRDANITMNWQELPGETEN